MFSNPVAARGEVLLNGESQMLKPKSASIGQDNPQEIGGLNVQMRICRPLVMSCAQNPLTALMSPPKPQAGRHRDVFTCFVAPSEKIPYSDQPDSLGARTRQETYHSMAYTVKMTQS